MREAEALAWRAGCDRVAVIAGVGTRAYYRKLGYELELCKRADGMEGDGSGGSGGAAAVARVEEEEKAGNGGAAGGACGSGRVGGGYGSEGCGFFMIKPLRGPGGLSYRTHRRVRAAVVALVAALALAALLWGVSDSGLPKLQAERGQGRVFRSQTLFSGGVERSHIGLGGGGGGVRIVPAAVADEAVPPTSGKTEL